MIQGELTLVDLHNIMDNGMESITESANGLNPALANLSAQPKDMCLDHIVRCVDHEAGGLCALLDLCTQDAVVLNHQQAHFRVSEAVQRQEGGSLR